MKYFNFSALFESIANNLSTVLVFLVVILGLFAIAFLAEQLIQKKNGVKEKVFTTRKIAMIGLFSALATVIMLFEIVMPFAPSFYKLDFSELPILIGTFAFGPAAGVMIEFIKVLLNLFIDGTSTAFVGEFANFCVGCSLIIPAGIIYNINKTKKGALIACIVGTVVLTIFGTSFNAVYLLPAFAKLYGMPLEAILGMGVKVNPLVKEGSIISFVCACVAPLNLIKGIANSIITLLIYKPLSPIIKGNYSSRGDKKATK